VGNTPEDVVKLADIVQFQSSPGFGAGRYECCQFHESDITSFNPRLLIPV
jgi:hypothetical protein